MYSKIPMPNIEWKDENRRFSLGFFPLIGAVIGAALILWRFICNGLNIGQFLFAAIAVSIPILISGGIHFDGFCDVTDAIHSYGDKNKKTEIMSDPHIGAFAVIYAIVYIIVQFGLFTQICTVDEAMLISCGFVLSRVSSSFSVIFLKTAKENSSLAFFKKPVDKTVTVIMEITCALICLALSFYYSWIICAVTVISLLLTFLFFKYTAYKNFGGITGDLCGWFLQMTELIYSAAAVFSLRIIEVFL